MNVETMNNKTLVVMIRVRVEFAVKVAAFARLHLMSFVVFVDDI